MIENREFDSHSLRQLHDFVRQTAISCDFARQGSWRVAFYQIADEQEVIANGER